MKRLAWLERVVGEFGWVLHSFCLMTNHEHLFVQTPHANLRAATGVGAPNSIDSVPVRRYDVSEGPKRGQHPFIDPWSRVFCFQCREPPAIPGPGPSDSAGVGGGAVVGGVRGAAVGRAVAF